MSDRLIKETLHRDLSQSKILSNVLCTCMLLRSTCICPLMS